MLAGMSTPTEPPKKPAGVRLSVTVSEADYVALEALKAKHRAETGKVLTTQEFVSALISERLAAIKKQ
jgi:hypothetical protein